MEIEEELKVFYAPSAKSRAFAASPNARFAHYTNADTALKILKTGNLWLRKTNCMNDYGELWSGVNHLRNYRKVITETLDHVFQHLGAGAISSIVNHALDNPYPLLQHTFVTCFSEHHAKEDRVGRLSMWRAYGRQAGVALVLRGEILFNCFERRGQWASPVFYADADIFAEAIKEWTASVVAGGSLCAKVDANEAEDIVERLISSSIICIKHRGFEEELEWRAIVTSGTDPLRRRHFIPSDCRRIIETIGGVPQPVYTMPLNCCQQNGENCIKLEDMIERIIIGPCAYPLEVKDALVETMSQVGIHAERIKIDVSDIPLRSSN